MPFISFTLYVFQFEISGKDINELHPAKIQLKDVISPVSHFDKSGKKFKLLHLENIPLIENKFELKSFIISDVFVVTFVFEFRLGVIIS